MSYVLSTHDKITRNEHVNEWKVIEMAGHTYYVNKFSICSTTIVDYEVWERCGNDYVAGVHTHSTITHNDVYGFLGDMTTRELPAEMNALQAGSDERIKAVTAWYDGNRAVAKALVLVAFPQDF